LSPVARGSRNDPCKPIGTGEGERLKKFRTKIQRSKPFYSHNLYFPLMKALILAAGEGTRMMPLTATLPKPLLPIAGKPCIRHTIDALVAAGIKDITFVVGWQRKEIQPYLESIKGIRSTFIEQKERLGTAHAINTAKAIMTEPFLCLNGDVIATATTLKAMVSAHKKRERPIIAVAEVSEPERYGVVKFSEVSGIVQEILEKPQRSPSRCINTGLYLFTPKIFEAIENTGQSPRGEFEVTDSIIKLSPEDRPYALQLKEPYIDISVPWDLLAANEFLMKGMRSRTGKGQVEKGVVIHGALQVGKGSIVKTGTYIEGNVIIGEGSKIGPRTYIRGSTCIGDRCHIGASVEIKNCIIMDETNVPHHNYVGDSIIGRRCNLGAGTKVANLRLDGRTITSYVKRKPVNTGLRKLGVIMGDDVKTGINASINVGTVIGEGSLIGLGAVATGWIEPRSQIF